MPCKKGTKQTPQEIIDQIIREHTNGATIKELSIEYRVISLRSKTSV